MKQNLVSIIIPLYNSEKWISQTIKSAINQSWESKEIIIFDDGSIDQSLSIAQKFESSIVKVFQQENQGGSNARNRALEESQGDYIQFLDADDILHPLKIEEQIKRLASFPRAVASGKFGNFIDKVENASYPFNEGFKDYETPLDWLIHANMGRAMFPPVVWLTPRNILDKAGPWNESLTYNDDSEFFCRVLLNAEKILYCSQSVSYYRRGLATSVGSRKDKVARKSELESLKLVKNHLLSVNDSTEVRSSLAYMLRRYIYSIYPRYAELTKDAFNQLNDLAIKGSFRFGKGKTNKLSRLIGWKAAKILHSFIYR